MVGGQWSYHTLSDIIDATNGRLPYAFKKFLVWARKATVSCSHDRLEHFFNHSQDIADEVLPFDTLMYDKYAVSLSKPICGTTSITASLDGLLDGRAAMIAGEDFFGLDRDGGYIIARVNSDGYLESAGGSTYALALETAKHIIILHDGGSHYEGLVTFEEAVWVSLFCTVVSGVFVPPSPT